MREVLEKGYFRKMDTEMMSIIILYAMKGLEVPYIRQNLETDYIGEKTDILEFIFNGIKETKDL